jgi:hypothetical protein
MRPTWARKPDAATARVLTKSIEAIALSLRRSRV